jgi:hypothetical protein
VRPRRRPVRPPAAPAEAALESRLLPRLARHLRRLRAALRERRDALAAALERALPELRVAALPAGGLHLWAALPDGADDVALAAPRRPRGVVVYPGRPWFPAEPPGPFLRLTFAAAPPEALDEGVRRLAPRAQTMIATAPPSTDHAAPVTMLARALREEDDDVGDLAGSARRPSGIFAACALERLVARDALAARGLVGEAAVGHPQRRGHRGGATALTSTPSAA